MGHCGLKNIRWTWGFVKVALIAITWDKVPGCSTLLDRNWGIGNPFYEIVPQWFLLASVGIATCAAVVACQAVISGSFTLINEAITLNFWPRVRVKFPN